ncbi:Scavenger receptor [Nesidiocoris tenuis]|uniref:Scavenger receptor n=1 Tax=Nesidiocoris tenuis TaxID=355587 RepID=A0ABN7AQK3_9HEMI|nr:Scavenger receptor [Nesidiocoris tenuis]
MSVPVWNSCYFLLAKAGLSRPAKPSKMANCLSWSLGITGTVALLLGSIGYFVWPVVLDSQLKKELALTNDSRSFSMWKETPIPMYMDIYMFNWTNPERSLKGLEKPNFVEMGPYSFREHHSKVNLAWNQNDTITFNQIRRWHFAPERSNGSLQDLVTNVNVIAMTVGNMIEKAVPKMLLPFIEPVMEKEESKTYVTKTVQELVFDGYSDNFLNIFQKLKKIIKLKIPFDKFGWFYQRNNSVTYDGTFNMNTGASSLRQLGNILEWNYSKSTHTNYGQCSVVHGSSGELWSSNAASQDHISIFASDICGSLELAYDGTKTVAGLPATVHIGDSLTLDNGQLSESNKCYCPSSGCPPSGARSISQCRFGAPAFISYPHFYKADESYLKKITGMHPKEELHQFNIALHKVTSIPVEVNGRLQINILAKKIDGLRFFNGLPNAYMPMMWFNQRATITPGLAGELKDLTDLAEYVEPSLIILAVIGLVLMASGLFIRFLRKKSASTTPLLSETSAVHDDLS